MDLSDDAVAITATAFLVAFWPGRCGPDGLEEIRPSAAGHVHGGFVLVDLKSVEPSLVKGSAELLVGQSIGRAAAFDEV
jgi:hypothetical protein